MDERAELLRSCDGAGQIPLELIAVVSLKNLRIRPVKSGFGKQTVGDRQIAAQALKHKNGIWIFFAYFSDNVFPGFRGDHIAGIAAETVDSETAPEKKHVGHIGAKSGIGIIKLDEILPDDPPRAGRNEPALFIAAEPFRMVRLQCRTPAGVVCRKIDEQKTAAGMNRADQLAELIKRRAADIEFRHRRIDRIKIGRRERTAVLAHDRICRRNRKRRQRLYDAKAHPVHDVGQTADDFAERTELARENRIDAVRAEGLAAFDLNMEIAAFRPPCDARTLRKETRFGGKNANLFKRKPTDETPGFHFRQRQIAPGFGKRSLAFFNLGDYLASPHRRAAEIGAQYRPAFLGGIQAQLHPDGVAAPFENKFTGIWTLPHDFSLLHQTKKRPILANGRFFNREKYALLFRLGLLETETAATFFPFATLLEKIDALKTLQNVAL